VLSRTARLGPVVPIHWDDRGIELKDGIAVFSGIWSWTWSLIPTALARQYRGLSRPFKTNPLDKHVAEFELPLAPERAEPELVFSFSNSRIARQRLQLSVVEPALQAAETARSAGRPTADPGADTDEVLRELGYPTEDIARLRTVGIV
jgi:hypothetical protein